MADRRQALDRVGNYGRAEMTQNVTSGNVLVERMSQIYLDNKGHSAFAPVSKALTRILRHGLSNQDVRGDREWELGTYDPETGWVRAREIVGHR